MSVTYLVIIDTVCTRVHLDERIAHDVVYERAGVELSEDEAEGVGGWVGEEDEAVSGEGLV